MRAALKRHGDLIQVVLGILVTVLAAVDMPGKPVRLVGLLTVAAGMFGAGVGLGQAIQRRRSARSGTGGSAA